MERLLPRLSEWTTLRVSTTPSEHVFQFHARQCKLLYPLSLSLVPSVFTPMLTEAQTHYNSMSQCPTVNVRACCQHSHVTAVMRTLHCSLRGTPAVVQAISRPISHYVFQGPGPRGCGSAVIYMSRLSGFYDITSCRLQFICSCTPPISWLR